METSKLGTRFLYGIITVSLISLSFFAGYDVGKQSIGLGPTDSLSLINADTYSAEATLDFRQFWQVWQYIKDNYVKADITEQQLFYGALDGLVASLQDPYSVFFDPEINKQFQQELSGAFEGIGAEIGIKENQLTIIAPLPSTPAERAGVLAGDRVLAIDGQDTAPLSLDESVKRIRGPRGSTVILTVVRTDTPEPLEISIVRDTIEIDSVRFVRKDPAGKQPPVEQKLMDGDIAYIELQYFNENTLADWNGVVSQILQANPRGIILDLRNNPGGFLDTAIEIAGEWAGDRPVVLERLRDGETLHHVPRRQARLHTIPTVVLINYGSASGSEIVAGALQDYDLATLVGEKTFGKGSVQDLREFSDGSSVKLTIAEWLTPLERHINNAGVAPDEEVVMTRDDFQSKGDIQLQKALELLR